MKTLSRWITNIKWLFNHPPVTITNLPSDARCDYCGATDGLYNVVGLFCICFACLHKVFDTVLKKETK